MIIRVALEGASPTAVAQAHGQGCSHPLPSVPARHVLVAEPEPDGEGLRYRVECPNREMGAEAPCASWEACGCTAEYEAEEDPCPSSPTGEHRYFDHEGLSAPTDVCWVATYDDLDEAAAGDVLAGPGRVPVDFEVDDEVYLVLAPAGPGPFEVEVPFASPDSPGAQVDPDEAAAARDWCTALVHERLAGGPHADCDVAYYGCTRLVSRDPEPVAH